MDNFVCKKVNIHKDNFKVLETLAENTDTPMADYLNYLINKAIIEEEKIKKAQNPLYLWKS